MNHSDIAALMKGAAPAIRDFVASAMKPLADRIGELERQLAEAKAVDNGPAIAAAVSSAIPVVDLSGLATKEELANVAREFQVSDKLHDDALATIDLVKADLADLSSKVQLISELPVPADGKDAEPPSAEILVALIAPLVESAVAAIPVPKDGVSVAVDDLRPMVEEVAALAAVEAVKAIPVPKDGAPGADGKLPIAKAYTEGVHYTGDVVTHDGATYQASKDTGHEPPHEDWICLARAGRDGVDGAEGRSFRIRGTYAEGVDDYSALDVVSLNGGAFIAKTDEPGVCPGPDWQLVASQGKRGAPGEAGKPGPRGAAAPVVVAASVDDTGMLTLTNADGSTVECDFYPVLSKAR